MAKIEQVMRAEIVRLARKEIRGFCLPVARDVRALKRAISRLGKAVKTLERMASSLAARQPAQPPKLEADEAEVKSARFSPGLIRKLRTRLGVTQAELAALLDASTTTVSFWEQGRNRPTMASRAAMVALRKLGRREARRLLEQKAGKKK